MQSCEAQCEVTADYGQRVYDFSYDFSMVGEETTLLMTAPEAVAGLTVTMTGEQGELSYAGTMVETGNLSDQGLSPVTAVPTMLELARSGFIETCTLVTEDEQEFLQVRYHDPELEQGEGQETLLTFDPDSGALLFGEIMVDGDLVLYGTFSTFTMVIGEKEDTTQR